jgi:hypothetical protein
LYIGSYNPEVFLKIYSALLEKRIALSNYLSSAAAIAILEHDYPTIIL